MLQKRVILQFHFVFLNLLKLPLALKCILPWKNHGYGHYAVCYPHISFLSLKKKNSGISDLVAVIKHWSYHWTFSIFWYWVILLNQNIFALDIVSVQAGFWGKNHCILCFLWIVSWSLALPRTEIKLHGNSSLRSEL